MLTKYPLKKHNINYKINKMKNILLDWVKMYSKKKIEINLIRLKYMFLNSSMISEYIALKLITKRRNLTRAKRKLFKKIKLVKFNIFRNNVFNLNNMNLHEKVINSLKYKYISGIRLVVAGRLTRRNTAARAVKWLSYKGSLKNIDASYKGLSVLNLRGYRLPNLDYSNYNLVAKTGAFSVKTWTSYYGYSTKAVTAQ